MPVNLHATNRKRLCERLKSKSVKNGALVLLQGGEEKCLYDTDTEVVFRQVISLLKYRNFTIKFTFTIVTMLLKLRKENNPKCFSENIA